MLPFSFYRRYLPKFLFPAVLLVLCFYVRIVQKAHIIDDAFITYRHVKNFIEGLGWVFNAGDGFLATSTPLYMILLTTLKSLFRFLDIETISICINTVCDLALAAFVYFVIFRKERLFVRFILTLPICFYPRLLDYSGCGMESSLFTLLIVAGIWTWTAGKWVPASILLGLTVLTRLDGLIPAAVCWALSYKKPRLILKSAAVAFAIQLPWLVFYLIRYDQILPVSVSGKIYFLGDGLVPNFQKLAAVFMEISPGHLLLYHWYAVVIGVIWFAALLFFYLRPVVRQADRQVETSRLILAFAGTALLFILAYIVGAPPLYGWYRVTIGTLILLSVLLMVRFVMGDVAEKSGLNQAAFQALLLVFVFMLVMYPWRTRINFFPDVQKRFTLVPEWDRSRDEDYRKAGMFLRQAADAGDAVFLEEAGTIGYYSGLKTFDGTGLTSPGIRNAIRTRAPLDSLIMALEVRWLVLRQSYFKNLKLDRYFTPAVDLGPFWQNQRIYERKSD
jgi:hypothetical protein